MKRTPRLGIIADDSISIEPGRLNLTHRFLLFILLSGRNGTQRRRTEILMADLTTRFKKLQK